MKSKDRLSLYASLVAHYARVYIGFLSMKVIGELNPRQKSTFVFNL